MNIALGQSALLLGLLGAVAGAATLLIGLARKRDTLLRAGQSYIWLVVAGAVIATMAMQRALITHDFTLVYVDNNDSTFTPLIYRITAMWSDLAGSILLWALVLSGYLAAMWIRFRKRRLRPFGAVGENHRLRRGCIFLRVDADRFRPLRPCSRGGARTKGPGLIPCSRTGSS